MNCSTVVLLKRCLPLLLLWLSIAVKAAPGDIIYSENFNGNLNDWTIDNSGGGDAAISNATADQGRSLQLRWDVVSVTSSNPIDTSVPAAELAIWVQRGSDAFSEDPDTGENLVIEYLNDSLAYVALETFSGDGTGGEIFDRTYMLPANALHANFSVRVRQTGGNGVDFDYWHIDTLVITERAPLVTCESLFNENFETDLSNWTIDNTGGGDAQITGLAADAGSSLQLRWNVVSVTNATGIDTRADFNDVQLAIWIRRGSDAFSEDPDTGEDLVLEYLNDTGSYTSLETFIGEGSPGEIFNRVYTLPSNAMHTNFRLRIRQTGGNGSNFDYWHVDSVSLNKTPDASGNCNIPVTDWYFDESLWDGSANEVVDTTGSINGTANGGLSTISSGQVCRAGQFDGSDDFITASGIDTILADTASLSFWIRTTQVGNNTNWLAPGIAGVEQAGGADDIFWGWINASGQIGVNSGNGSTGLSTTPINDGNWHHVILTRDAVSGATQTFVDGVLETSAVSAAGVIGTGFSSIGRIEDTGGTPAYLQGDLDEVLLFNEAIDATVAQGIYNNQLAGNNWDGSTRSCPVPLIDHFRIEHAGNIATCAATAITISARLADGSLDNSYTGTVSLSTSTANGDWSGLATGSGSDAGTGSYTFTAINNGEVILQYKNTHVEAVSLNVSDGGISETSGSAAVSDDPLLTVSDSAFLFSAIPDQTAALDSAVISLQAVRASDSNPAICEPAFSTGSDIPIELAAECIDPSTCVAGQSFSVINNTNTTAITLNDDNSGAGVASYQSVNLRFGANSTANLQINYTDVGQMQLHARYNIPLDDGSSTPSGNFMLGSSNNFIVSPDNFNIVLTGNPAAIDASGGTFARAGESFSVSVEVRNANNALTPNYGNENIAEGIVLTRGLVAPVGGSDGTLTGSLSPSATAGVFTGDHAWNEVGIISLTADVADNNYLGAGNTTATLANVGRFYPDHFEVTTPNIMNRIDESCLSPSAFTYMNETFTVEFTVEAHTAEPASTITRNYINGFAKLDSFAELNVGALHLMIDRTTRLVNDATVVPWTWDVVAAEGTADVIARLQFQRDSVSPATPDGSFDSLSLAVALEDDDVVQLLTSDFDIDIDGDSTDEHIEIGTTNIRYGRAVVENAFGPETRDLAVLVRTEYFNGSQFILNTADNCTSFATGDVGLSNYIAPLTSATVGSVLSPTVSGEGNILLDTPNASGSVDVQLTVPVYLQFDWDGTPLTFENPQGTATFGTYRGNDRIIYRREVLQ